MNGTAELAQRPKELPLEQGMVKCSSLEEAYRYANAIVQSGLAPTCFNTKEKVLIAMQYGAEVGLKPMQALQSIAVVNGRPGLYGKSLPGVVLQHGVMEAFEEWIEGEGETLVAVCKVRRKGLASERVERFGVADARRAGLWDKAGPWKQYPKDMLKYKARSRAFNAMFADVLCGLPVIEDIQDVAAERKGDKPDAPIQDPLLKQVKAIEGPTITATVIEDDPPKPVPPPSTSTPLPPSPSTGQAQVKKPKGKRAAAKQNPPVDSGEGDLSFPDELIPANAGPADAIKGR